MDSIDRVSNWERGVRSKNDSPTSEPNIFPTESHTGTMRFKVLKDIAHFIINDTIALGVQIFLFSKQGMPNMAMGIM
jgi:hypothetical protein